MNDCIFCKIANGEIPSKKVFENEEIMAFYDIKPQMPIHIIVIPKKHIESVSDLSEEDELLVGKIFITIKNIAHELEIDKTGYRVLTNNGEDAGQTIKHLHFHILAGEKMSEKIV